MATLVQKVEGLKAKIAKAAQEIYEAWNQDEEGFDEYLGTGGICDEVSSKIAEVVSDSFPELDARDGGQEGDDHAFMIFFDDKEAVVVDIPPSVYESGGGYSWTKKPEVTIEPEDVVVESIERKLIDM